MEKKFYRVRNKYLAEGLSFLGFRYKKFGYGKETVYTFEDTDKFRDVVDTLLEIKKMV